jgi:hypothetical protein
MTMICIEHLTIRPEFESLLLQGKQHQQMTVTMSIKTINFMKVEGSLVLQYPPLRPILGQLNADTSTLYFTTTHFNIMSLSIYINKYIFIYTTPKWCRLLMFHNQNLPHLSSPMRATCSPLNGSTLRRRHIIK